MSSLTDHDFDAGLDRLLAESVRPGAEPDGFALRPMPPRPRFNRVLAGGVIACLAPVIILAAGLYSVGTGVLAPPGLAPWTSLSDSLIAGAEALASAEFLMNSFVVMAAVYAFAASRIMLLLRHR